MKAIDRAMQLRGQISNTGEQPHIKMPEKTLAGGATSALGGAAAGATIGAQLGTSAGPYGTAIGAGVGALIGGAEYYTS